MAFGLPQTVPGTTSYAQSLNVLYLGALVLIITLFICGIIIGILYIWSFRIRVNVYTARQGNLMRYTAKAKRIYIKRDKTYKYQLYLGLFRRKIPLPPPEDLSVVYTDRKGKETFDLYQVTDDQFMYCRFNVSEGIYPIEQDVKFYLAQEFRSQEQAYSKIGFIEKYQGLISVGIFSAFILLALIFILQKLEVLRDFGSAMQNAAQAIERSELIRQGGAPGPTAPG